MLVISCHMRCDTTVVLTWYQHGIKVPPMWYQHGINVVLKWCFVTDVTRQVQSMWYQHGIFSIHCLNFQYGCGRWGYIPLGVYTRHLHPLSMNSGNFTLQDVT
jgi:hypothetical protein